MNKIKALFFLSILFSFFFFAQETLAATHTVCNSSCDFTSITSAIGDPGVSNGDNLFINSGYAASNETYPLMINKGVTIDCQNSGANLGSAGPGVVLMHATVASTKIQNCNASYLEILDTVVDHLTITGNTFLPNSGSFISIGGGSVADISFNTGLNRIVVYGTDDASVLNNTVDVYDNSTSHVGISVTGAVTTSTGAVVSNNTVNQRQEVAASDFSLIFFQKTDGTQVASNTVKYLGNISGGYGGAIHTQGSTNLTIAGNYITMPATCSNTGGGANAIWIYTLNGDISGSINHNTISIPAACDSSHGIKIVDSSGVSYDTDLTLQYNLVISGSNTNNSVGLNINKSGSGTMTITDDYDDYYNLQAAYGISGVSSINGGHDLSLDPFLMTDDADTSNDLYLAPFSPLININGSNDIGAYSTTTRRSTINVDDNGVVDYSSVDATSTSLIVDALKSGDTLNLLTGSYGNLIVSSTLATSGLTIKGQGASTIINTVGANDGISLNNISDSIVKDLVVKNASSSVSSYTVTNVIYNYNSTTYDKSSVAGAPGDGYTLIVTGTGCQIDTYNTDDYDITSLVGSATNNWHLALISVGAPGTPHLTMLVPNNYAPDQGTLAAQCSGNGVIIDKWVDNLFSVSNGNFTYIGASALALQGVSMTSGYTNPARIDSVPVTHSGIKLNNSSNNLIENVTSTVNNYGVWFSGTSAGNSVSSTLFSASLLYDIFSDSSDDNNIKNSTFVNASSSISGLGNVKVYFKTQVHVKDFLDNDISGASVHYQDNASSPTVTVTTDVNGLAFSDNLLAYKMTSTSLAETSGGYNPFTASVDSVSFYLASSTSFNLNIPNQLVIISLRSGLNTAPVATAIYPDFAIDGGGLVSVTSTISDADGDTSKLFIDYSLDNGVTWASSTINSVTGSGTFTTTTGRIEGITDTLSGNAITFKWNSQADGATSASQAKLRITPYDGSDSGTTRVSAAFVVDNVAPVAPANITLIPDSTSITVSWDSLSGILVYSVSSTASSVTSTASTNKIFGSLLPNTQYIFQVRATDNYGNVGIFSDTSSTYTNAAVPDVPVSSANGQSSLIVSWGNNNNSAGTIYELYNVTLNSVVTSTISETSFIATNLSAGNSYQFKVRAQNKIDNTSWSAYSGDSDLVSTSAVGNSVNMVLGVGQSSTFQLDGGPTHTVTANSIILGVASLTIASSPVTVNLSAGQSTNIDTDGNGVNDTTVTMNSVGANSVNFSLSIFTPQATTSGGGGGGGYAPSNPPSLSVQPIIFTTEFLSIGLRINFTFSVTNAVQTAIADNPNFNGSSWQTYSSAQSYTLPLGTLDKVLYIKFRSREGGETQIQQVHVVSSPAINTTPVVNPPVSSGSPVVTGPVNFSNEESRIVFTNLKKRQYLRGSVFSFTYTNTFKATKKYNTKIVRELINSRGKIVKSSPAWFVQKPGSFFKRNVKETISWILPYGVYTERIRVLDAKTGGLFDQNSFEIEIVRAIKK